MQGSFGQVKGMIEACSGELWHISRRSGGADGKAYAKHLKSPSTH
jgi:hypothetical protein